MISLDMFGHEFGLGEPSEMSGIDGLLAIPNESEVFICCCLFGSKGLYTYMMWSAMNTVNFIVKKTDVHPYNWSQLRCCRYSVHRSQNYKTNMYSKYGRGRS